MSGTDTYYHHTNRDGAKKILKSGVIQQSQKANGDAVYGDGAYLTKLGPSESREKVAINNYDGMKSYYQSKISEGKTDVAIEMKIPRSKVQNVSSGGRDVHLYPGDLRLSDAQDVKVHVRDKDNVRTFQK